MQEKIKKLEEEIRNLHYNPKLKKHSFSVSHIAEWMPEFWDYHVKYVIGQSRKMARKYGADEEVVWLGSLLHDIARLDDKNPHDEIGSKIALNLLIEKGFSEKIAKRVEKIVLTHSCLKFKPESLEEKIVASADAMAHFVPPFYLWYAKYMKDNFKSIMESNANKIERDYQEKIFFAEEKEEVKEIYGVLKGWCEYKV